MQPLAITLVFATLEFATFVGTVACFIFAAAGSKKSACLGTVLLLCTVALAFAVEVLSNKVSYFALFPVCPGFVLGIVSWKRRGWERWQIRFRDSAAKLEDIGYVEKKPPLD